MKKLKTLISTALCLCAVCALALPAHALEYSISAPGNPEYGHPTSFEPVVTADGGAMKNEDLSKSAALIPPGFGTPTSYLPGSGEYLTPNLVPSQMAGAGHFEGTSIWDGNVPIAGHNRGVRNDFGRIHTLRAGDIITFTTRLGTCKQSSKKAHR